MATRRDILRALALGLGVVACRKGLAQPAENAVYVGFETASQTNSSHAAFFAGDGERVASVPLDFRAHGAAQDNDRLVVFPRRPGDRFAVVNSVSLEIVSVIAAPRGRHFYGHGAFTRDGAYLLVPENDLETLSGAIGVYEANSQYRRTGHIPLGGAGPHEIIRHAEQNLFFIALGGLETHPDYGRTPLNLAGFRSQIICLDWTTAQPDPLGFWPGTEGISLRHLAADAKGRMYIGGQLADPYRGTARNVLWLLDGERATLVEAGEKLHGYVSSVAAYGLTALATSKEAGVALTLNGDQQTGLFPADGASAAAMGPAGMVVSGFKTLTIEGAQISARPFCEFDNHGLMLG